MMPGVTAIGGSIIAARARSACGMTIEYKLGAGGMKPERPVPHNSDQQSDCSGFVSWCIGLSRQCSRIAGGWIETTAMYRDARERKSLFEQVPTPAIGNLLVYPDKTKTIYEGGQKKRTTRQGHVGVITEVQGGRATKVVHCSSGNFRRTGKAVQETSADVFYSNGAICIRFKGEEK